MSHSVYESTVLTHGFIVSYVESLLYESFVPCYESLLFESLFHVMSHWFMSHWV